MKPDKLKFSNNRLQTVKTLTSCAFTSSYLGPPVCLPMDLDLYALCVQQVFIINAGFGGIHPCQGICLQTQSNLILLQRILIITTLFVTKDFAFKSNLLL